MNSIPVIPDISALSLRRRGVWEAVDSGVLLWRSNFTYLLPFFAIPVWFIAWGLRLLPGNFVYLSYLVLWWLKPFFDRLVLFVVSRNFLNTPFKFIELVKMKNGLLGDLLWRRFNLSRSASMPIRVLENLNNKQFALRKKALHSSGLAFSNIISPLSLIMEFMLLFGEVLFFLMFVQLFFPIYLSNILNYGETVEIFIYMLFCFNYILVESIYVCMGFGLYINGRVELEGWDLQLLFKNFVKQGSKIIAFVFLFLSLLFTPAPAYALNTEPVFPEGFPEMPIESLANLDEILASSDFGGERDGWTIQFRNYREPDMPVIEMAPWMENIRLIFSYTLRIMAILALAAFMVFIFYWSRKNKQKFFLIGNSFLNKGKNYANSLVSIESPSSLFDRAEVFFHRGLIREAWAACFFGCLGAFAINGSVSFPADATEYECLNLVQQIKPGAGEGFAALVQSWVLFAYGNMQPLESDFNKALVYGRSLLCEETYE